MHKLQLLQLLQLLQVLQLLQINILMIMVNFAFVAQILWRLYLSPYEVLLI